MIAGKESDYLEYRRLWDLTSRRELLTEVPLHLDIELTNHCNLRCKMCWQSEFFSYPKGYMSFDLYQRIVDEGVDKGVKAIKLQSRGESMIHPRIVDAIRYAKEKGIQDIHLTTNGTLLFRDKWLDFLESGLDVLNFSLDNSHKESYENLHMGKSYNEVIENIVGFLEMRKSLGYKSPFMKTQTAISKVMDDFTKKQIERIHGLVDRIIVNPTFSLVDDKTSKTNEINLGACNYLWQRMVINYDGKATMCCRDYNCMHIMGDITKQTLEEIWFGEKYLEMREFHSIGKRNKIPVCNTCVIY